MAIQLDFSKLPANGHITVMWALPNAFANFKAPTTTELNAALNLSRSISWNDFDFGMSASNTQNDPSLADKGNVTDRGAAQYGGGISFYYPREFDDNTSEYSLVFDAMDTPRTRGFIVVRIDGNKPTTSAFADGDYIHVMEVMTDAATNVITGEEAFRYTVNFLQQGGLVVYGVAHTGSVTVDVLPATLATSAGDFDRLSATAEGREYTNGMRWSSSDTSVATVSPAGVVSSLAAGTATITATYPGTGATDTCVVTVS
jgi:hypothetical protein